MRGHTAPQRARSVRASPAPAAPRRHPAHDSAGRGERSPAFGQRSPTFFYRSPAFFIVRRLFSSEKTAERFPLDGGSMA
jgi:hypothetical protein